MKFTSILSLLALSAYTSAEVMMITYDQTYDNPGQSLSTFACSDGENGLLTKGFSTFASLPTFPYIGGTAAVPGWNSISCGTCWNIITYNNSKSIYVTVIDHATHGFNIGLQAMNELTDSQGQFLGHVDAFVMRVESDTCGMD